MGRLGKIILSAELGLIEIEGTSDKVRVIQFGNYGKSELCIFKKRKNSHFWSVIFYLCLLNTFVIELDSENSLFNEKKPKKFYFFLY